MIGVLLAVAMALLLWPAARHPLGTRARRSKPRAGVTSLDRRMPAILGAVAGLLVTAWKPTLAGTAIGLAVGGAVFALLTKARSRASRESPDESLPLALSVAALLLRSGRPPAEALAEATARCASRSASDARSVARRIAMGEPSAQAWEALLRTPGLGAIGRAARRASDSGAALAQAWEATAAELRADQRLAAEVAARKVGIRALAPLGLCFLPSFICLGVIPIVIGLAGDIL